ncbi:hypothetical protein [Rathayibacter agropyri]|uniref:hypothetical protein n=1 Tax=Rathayibacter agropyri TaxID=1634927 RepID=UPI001565C031|nr:hypothetical protein [Rathayibacter agropyri]NRD09465.1 hypothetical protein [Rathayibacter agropyri]
MAHTSTFRPDSDRAVTRRSVTSAAVWSVPVVAAVAATPSAAASNGDVGAFTLSGTCGTLGVLGPGFLLKASASEPLPTGTSVTVTGSGIANIGVFSFSGGAATGSILSSTSQLITLTAPLPAGATLAMRTTLSISVAFKLNAAALLPAGYTGTGAKTSGSVSSTLIFCQST